MTSRYESVELNALTRDCPRWQRRTSYSYCSGGSNAVIRAGEKKVTTTRARDDHLV